MVNSTEEFWDVDGVSLQTLVQNLTTWGGDREAPPPVRGSNVMIPGAPGESFVPKYPGARTITLDGWLLGSREKRTPLHRNLAWNPKLAGGKGILAQQYVDGGSDPAAVVTNVLSGADLQVSPTWPVDGAYDGGTPGAGGTVPLDGGSPASGAAGADGGAAVNETEYQLDGGTI